MRYRVLRGGPACRFAFSREAKKKAPEKAAPPLSAALANPYWRCYGASRTREQLRQGQK